LISSSDTPSNRTGISTFNLFAKKGSLRLQAKLANAARKESDAKKALLFQYAVKSVADVIAEKCRLIEMEYHERELA